MAQFRSCCMCVEPICQVTLGQQSTAMNSQLPSMGGRLHGLHSAYKALPLRLIATLEPLWNAISPRATLERPATPCVLVAFLPPAANAAIGAQYTVAACRMHRVQLTCTVQLVHGGERAHAFARQPVLCFLNSKRMCSVQAAPMHGGGPQGQRQLSVHRHCNLVELPMCVRVVGAG
jgi:hypothetical protein